MDAERKILLFYLLLTTHYSLLTNFILKSQSNMQPQHLSIP